MDFHIWVALICAIIFIPPVWLFRPLIVAIANRINGKGVNTEEVKVLKTKVANLEAQIMEMRGRMLSIEDHQDFSKKLEDSTKRK